MFEQFSQVDDPRHQGYIDHPIRLMLGTIYYKCIAGITSTREMTNQFNKENVANNIRKFLGEKDGEYLPHGVTINELIERLNPEELKQDCEIKAFKRLAEKIKARYPKLPIIVMADSLYASETFMDICIECGIY